MYETIRRIVYFAAGHFLVVLAFGIGGGVLYGVVTSLMDGNFFIEVLVIDGIVGFFFALFAGLLALYLRPQLTARADSDNNADAKTWKEIIYPKFMLGDETRSKSSVANLTAKRNGMWLGLVLVALTTITQTIGSPNPILPIIGGAAIVGLLFVAIAFTTSKIDRLSREPNAKDEQAPD